MKIPLTFTTACFLTLTATAVSAPKSHRTTAASAYSPTEKWVIEQVRNGWEADLRERFPTAENKRTISASFVEELLKSEIPEFKPHREGIRITGAVIDGPIDLEGAEISCDVWLDDCQFNDSVSFTNTRFAKDVSFDDSAFAADAAFDDIKVKGTAYLRKIHFAGSFTAARAEFSSDVYFDDSKFLSRKDEADFTGMKGAGYTSFSNTRFVGTADFDSASFAGNLEFDGARFRSREPYGFNSLRAGTTIFTGAIFSGPADFTAAEITGELNVSEAQFKCKNRKNSFDFLKVSGAAIFSNAVFAGPTSFVDADFVGRVYFNETKFLNQQGQTDFNGMKIGGNATFSKAMFAGPVILADACFSNLFVAEGALFLCTDKPVNFVRLKVVSRATFDHAIFMGPVNFGTANFGNQFSAAWTQFKSTDQEVSFNSMKVAGHAIFKNATFAGPVDFGKAEFDSQLQADEVQFQSSDKETSFGRMKVGDLASFDKAIFTAPVSFRYALISSGLRANGAQFLCLNKKADFSGIKVDGPVFFLRTNFTGPVDMEDATFLDLQFSAAKSDVLPVPLLNLSRTVVTHKLDLSELRIQDLIAPWLHVEGAASLTDLQVVHAADLSYGDFSTLDLSRSHWPSKASRKLRLQGMNYKYIRADHDESDSHAALLKLADQAAYEADVYGNLEAFYTRQGYRDDANAAYIAGRSRERTDNLSWLSLGYYWNWLLQGIGYGRYPGRAIVACAFIIGLGCLLFTPSKMEPQKSDGNPRWMQRPMIYHRFWYSLELFLPFVKLQSEDVWAPKRECRFLRHYMRVHTLLGWVLIPIALAAVSGLIK